MTKHVSARSQAGVSSHRLEEGRRATPGPASPLQAAADVGPLVQRLAALQAAADVSVPVVQRTRDQDFTEVKTLTSLNAALGNLTPAVGAIGLADYPTVVGATVGMLDWVIAQDQNMLYNDIPRADVIDFYTDALRNRRDNAPAIYVYDTHGDKHFAGGPKGTKFNAGKGVVNPQIERLIQAQIGRIRQHANGSKALYYFTAAPLDECPANHILTIQLDYTPSTNTIGYHGYPDRFTGSLSLSTAKGGSPI